MSRTWLCGTLLVSIGCAMTPPQAERRPVETVLHGRRFVDDYAWLRDREDPAVMAYLEAENAYTESMMAPTKPLQKALYEEILGRLKEEDQTVPYRRRRFWYYARTEEKKSYQIYCRREGTLEDPEQVLLDVNHLAEGKEYLDLGVLEVSPDERWLAYSTDEEGDERFVLRFMDLQTGALTSETIPNTGYSVVWAADNRTIFYDVLDEQNRPYRLYRHRVGTDPKDDQLVYEETDDRFFLSAHLTRSEAFVVVSVDSAITSEVRLIDATSPDATPRLVRAREQGVEYEVAHQGDRLLILHNREALNFEVAEASTSDPGEWRTLIPHRPEVLVSDVLAFKDWLVIFERKDGLPQVRVRSQTGEDHWIAFDEPTYDVWEGANELYETQSFRFGFSSLLTPASVFEYQLAERTRTRLKERPVIGYDRARYVSERIFAEAEEGVRIPISIVYAKDRKKDGASPLLLTAYGAYGDSYDPDFSSSWVSLLDRGVAVAIAHVRGGGEMGRAWKEAGRLGNKPNTFADVIRCAEKLIDDGYSRPERMALSGRSAGGLMVGAVINQRPDLFIAALAGVPFVDVINTMLDETIPLTVVEWEEWGNPKELEAFQHIASYSPYDNVTAQTYPHLLVRAGINDPRVGYWEPAKWVAKLRSLETDDRWLLLQTELGAGHGGPTGRYRAIEDTAFEYAFLLDRMGVKR